MTSWSISSPLMVFGTDWARHLRVTKCRTAMEARPVEALSRHVVTNVLVTVIDADHADVISYKSIYRHEEGEMLDKPVPLNGPKWVSVYADEMVRTDDGWRIKRKEGTTLFEREPVPY